ncbi:ATP-binding protein [Kitasatospora misakiensis]|uniref:ATP-binding protein n=1 Tax=Kitasatospora misakiensis TaxID=67330 RepID=A0ABW0WZN4_9ACTN
MVLPLLRPLDADAVGEFRLDLFPPAAPEVVGVLRRLLREMLTVVGADPDGPCLILSELVTNALLHGAGAPSVVLELRCGRLYIAVADGSTAVPRRREPDVARTCGRGLDLVAALADDWGVELIGVCGKAVWAVAAVDH